MTIGKKERIVVIGGGFAGLNFIKKIDKKRYDVVLIDRHNYHSFPPLFYQVASAGLEPASISFPFRSEFRKRRFRSVTFNIGEVKTIDLGSKTICTCCGTIRYDKLVIAAGTTNNFFSNAELVKHVYTIKSAPEAIRCRNDILDRFEQAAISADPEKRRMLLNFVVIGGGPTGVEIAGALGEMKRYILPRDYPTIDKDDMSITLFEGSDRLLRTMNDKSSAAALNSLEALMVNVKLGLTMQSLNGNKMKLSDGSEREVGMLIWTAGVTGVNIDVTGGTLTTVKGNRLKVDTFNRVEGVKGVYAIGDICWTDTDPDFPTGHPQLAQVAIQQARNLAANLNRHGSMRPFHYHDKGSMATIGRNRAVVEFRHANMSGFPAWLIWMFVHLMSLVGFRNKIVVFFNWLWAYFTYGTALRLLIHPCKYPLRRRWDDE